MPLPPTVVAMLVGKKGCASPVDVQLPEMVSMVKRWSAGTSKEEDSVPPSEIWNGCRAALSTSWVLTLPLIVVVPIPVMLTGTGVPVMLTAWTEGKFVTSTGLIGSLHAGRGKKHVAKSTAIATPANRLVLSVHFFMRFPSVGCTNQQPKS